MVTVGAYEAKTRLPELLRMVEAGERVTITRHGRPVALITAPAGFPDKTTAEAAAPDRVNHYPLEQRHSRLAPPLTTSFLGSLQVRKELS